MECPKCGNKGSNVINSRKVEMNVFRIRICKNCAHKFYTEESEIDIEDADIYMAELQRLYREQRRKR